jgi:hypothetical protein
MNTTLRLWSALAVVALLLSACPSDPPEDADPDPGNNGATNNGGGPTCGDGICETGETQCPADCEAANNGNVTCGDGVCDPNVGEDTDSCPADCGGPDEDCNLCDDTQSCVTNDAVTDACFDSNCADEDCGEGEVCDEQVCVSESCAGLDCGGYPNVCRGGVCVTGSCSDPDVRCHEGTMCVDDECLTPCTETEECLPLACIDNYCRVCGDDLDCGANFICVSDQCVPPCTDSPDDCEDGLVCDPETGRCDDACTADSCGEGEICDPDTGLCTDGECSQNGMADPACPGGHICDNGVCIPFGPLFFGSLCSGCQYSISDTYSGAFVLGSMELSGPAIDSENYTLQPGAIHILSGTD